MVVNFHLFGTTKQSQIMEAGKVGRMFLSGVLA